MILLEKHYFFYLVQNVFKRTLKIVMKYTRKTLNGTKEKTYSKTMIAMMKKKILS